MWLYNGKELNETDVPLNAWGFIYKITHDSGKWYIGKKLLSKAATKTVKGVKKKIRKESDWKDYWSSSPFLLEEIERLGKDTFKREILLFTTTKGATLYAEEHLLMVSGSMFDENCYNGNIRSRIQKSWFKKTPDLFNELQKIKL